MKLDWLSAQRRRIAAFTGGHKGILIIMGLLFAQRLFVLWRLGVTYSLNSDDVSYVVSGITFAQTGTITMHNAYPSAQIMPGMTVFIGLLSLVFGEGWLLWLVLKLIWVCLGTLTAYFIYKAVSLYAPNWCGLLAASLLFAPNFAWMDNLILSETPFVLLFTIMVYATLRLGRARSARSFFLCLAAYMLALMLKANIAVYPLFAAAYLLFARYPWRLLLRQAMILAATVLVFVIPWSIRNNIHFHTFIPLTYGSGNPTLLGTYQGEGYPLDGDLDYQRNVEEVYLARYSSYLQEGGSPADPKYARFLSLEKDGLKASYRMREWRSRDPISFVRSYLWIKPKQMLNSVFYWKQILGIPKSILTTLRSLEFFFFLFTIAAAFLLKKHRKVILFLSALYFANLLLYAFTFSFDRYAESLITLRYISVGIGVGFFFTLLGRAIRSVHSTSFSM